MVALICCWALIAAFSAPLGHSLLCAAYGDRDNRLGDWLVQALWLGLIACEWLAAAVSLIAPVTPSNLGVVVGVSCAVALAANSRTSAGWALGARLRQLIRLDAALTLAVIVTFSAFVAANLRSTPDTGGYHIPAIRWLAEYGLVTGVAHIQIRFGFISSVWAMVAPFDTVFDGRADGVVNGFVLCMVSGQIVIALGRVARGVSRPSDIFLAVASAGLLAIGLVIGSFSTPSPDPSLAALTCVIAWRLLASVEAKSTDRSMVPLLLACGALNAKLSGLLLVPIAGLYVVLGSGMRRWIGAGVVTAVLVAPFFVASVMASGCLALPAAITCLPVPWALPIESVKELGAAATLFSRWDSQVPPNPGAWNWIPGWLMGTRLWLNASVFWPFVACLAGFLWVTRRDLNRGEIWVLALLVPSLVLLFAVAPEIRYNAGLFVIPVALFAMRLIVPPTKTFAADAATLVGAAAAVVIVQVTVSGAIEYRRSGHITIAERLVRPRAIPVENYLVVTAPGIRYNMAISGYCWRAPLPCASTRLGPVILRAPARDLAAGFQSAR